MVVPLLAAASPIAALGFGLFGKKKRRPKEDPELARMQAQWARDDQLAAQQRREREAAEAKAAQEKQAAEATWRAGIDPARQAAMSNANRVIQGLGLNPADFSQQLGSEFDRVIGGLGVGSNVTTALDGRGIAQRILDDELQSRRQGLTTQVNQKFGQNYGDNLIDDNALNGLVDEIVGTQRQSALDFIERGTKRGIYNDVGRNAAMSRLGEQEQSGRSQLSGLATNVIRGYEGQADRVRDNAFNSAQGFTWGSNFNLDDYLGQGSRVKSQFDTNAAGDLRGAFGGTQIFDFSGLKNTAGQAQGAINLRDTEIGSALENRRRQGAQQRGLGSQGAF